MCGRGPRNCRPNRRWRRSVFPLRLTPGIRTQCAVGLRYGPRFLRRGHLDDEVLFFIRHERDTFGGDAIDECRENLRCQLDRVQRLDQFCLRELSFGASCLESCFEVDL